MFSVTGASATTRTGSFRRLRGRKAQAKTVAAPIMSYFISPIEAAGLIEMPPESKVIPLPTRTAVPCGARRAGTRRSGRPEAGRCRR